MASRLVGLDTMASFDPRAAVSGRESVNLDVLRSVAVLMVLCVHLLLYFRISHLGWLPLLGFGQWGVLIFFFHTSLVLMRSLARLSHDAASRPSLAEFMLRRCFRLLPLCWVVILFVAATHVPVGHTHDGRLVAVPLELASLCCNMLLIQNLTGTESAIATLWSLPYEMQMYLLLPTLFWMARAARVRTVLCVWLASALAAVCCRFEGAEPLRDALWLVPCFYAGIVAFKLSAHVRQRMPGWAWPLLLLTLTLLYLICSRPSVGALGCLMLGLWLPRIRELRHPALRVVSQLIARYSYGIYLTHLICLWLAFELLSGAPLALRWVVFVATTIMVPVVLYHVVEQPMIVLGGQLSARMRRRQQALDALSCASTAVQPLRRSPP